MLWIWHILVSVENFLQSFGHNISATLLDFIVYIFQYQFNNTVKVALIPMSFKPQLLTISDFNKFALILCSGMRQFRIYIILASLIYLHWIQVVSSLFRSALNIPIKSSLTNRTLRSIRHGRQIICFPPKGFLCLVNIILRLSKYSSHFRVIEISMKICKWQSDYKDRSAKIHGKCDFIFADLICQVIIYSGSGASIGRKGMP